MGYAIADCITGRPIREGDRVVAYLMTEARDEQNITYLIGDTADRYKLASLPIEGKWDGFHVQPDDASSIAVRSAIYAAASKVDTLDALQELLYTNSIQDIPAEQWPWMKDSAQTPPPVKMNFSLFVTTPESLELMFSEPSVARRFPLDIEEERKLVEPLLEKLQPYIEAMDSPDREIRMNAFQGLEVYGYAVFFSTQDIDPEDAKVPYACKRTLRTHDGIISNRLHKFLGENELAGHKAINKLGATGTLPPDYDQVFKGLHSLKLMTESMRWLDIAIQPAAKRSLGVRSLDRVGLLRAMLVKEMGAYIEGIDGYKEPEEALQLVDSILNPLKADLAKLVKARNVLSRNVQDDLEP